MSFLNPREVVEQIVLAPDAVVVDLGAGAGFYTFAAANKVHDGGRVTAIDIIPDLVSRIAQHAKENKIKNVEVRSGNIEESDGSGMSDACADWVFLTNALFQVEERGVSLQEAFRILKKGGKLLLVDWIDSFAGMGPQPERVMPKEVACALAEKRGFTYVRDINAGDHHWGVVMRK